MKQSPIERIPPNPVPFLLASSLDPVEEVLIVKNARTAGVVERLQAIVPKTGARLQPLEFPDGVESDVWMQDTVEIGRICVPTRDGIEQTLTVLTGLRAHCPHFDAERLDRNIRQYFSRRGAVLVDPGTPRKDTRWIDWYGNLEVSPPVTARNGQGFPCGRVLTGRQRELEMHPGALAFLEAQHVQTPPLMVDVSWLLIGHVDEVVNFVPAPDGPGFRALIPSPSLARRILQSLISRKLGDRMIFAGREDETTAQEMLETVARSEENAHIVRALAETRAQLCEGLGIEEEHFIEIPALFRDGIAVIPNMVNGLICNGHAILPAPLGPQADGHDAFASPVQSALADLGVQVHFLDIWNPYHKNLGEIHCGTNTVRHIRHTDPIRDV